MPRYRIQRRRPGPFEDPSIGWDDVTSVEAASGDAALAWLVHQQQWRAAHPHADQVVVPGVGMYRAVADEASAMHRFVVQRQDEMGPHDRHATWSDHGSIEATSEAAAIREYCARHGWGSVTVQDTVFMPYGLGWFRLVPAEAADEARVTPAPALD